MTGTSMESGAARPVPPASVRTLAHERRAARIARDWGAADRLKREIEAAGWRVVDRGPDFALVPAIPPDRTIGDLVVHGAPDRVPSELETPARPGATLVLLGGTANLPASVAHTTSVRVVLGTEPAAEDASELVRLAPDATIGALAEAGLHRVATEWVVFLPDAAEAPPPDRLLDAIATLPPGEDRGIVACGLVGARTPDLHRFIAVSAGEADLLLAGPIAARRNDLAALLPFERRIVSPDRFAQWLSLALRRDTVVDAGAPPRRIVVVDAGDPGLVERRAAAASADRIAKRDFYRILDRFGTDPALLSVDR